MFKKLKQALSRIFDTQDDLLRFKRVGHHDLPIPQAESYWAAGIDLRCAEKSAYLPAGGRRLIKTGFACAIPYGFVGMVCPRSGLALKKGLTVLNAPGIVDADYRGEIGVILVNTSDTDMVISYGERIAQLVISEASNVGLCGIEVEELDVTARGEDGFGSTGIA